jgi:LmeA-like phospholipid-binding
MRGCLGLLFLAVIAVAVGLWFGAPPIAERLVSMSLGSAGLRSGDLAVSVQADPPLELALGHADRVVVTGTNVAWHGYRARAMDLALEDVDLLGRSAARTTGELTGVELPGVEPAGSLAAVEIDGRGPSAAVTITIDRSTAEAMAAAAFEQRTGIRPGRTTLGAPNVIRFEAGQVAASGAMTIDPDGSLGVATPRGRVVILEPGASDPIRLTGLEVEGDDLVLTGSVDVASLIR